MSITNIPFSHSGLIALVVAGLALLLLLKLIKIWLPKLIQRQAYKESFLRYYPLFEIGIGLLFITYAIDKLSTNNPLYALGLFVILFIITLWITWYYTKGYVLGILFKLNSKFSLHDNIRFKAYQGKIIEMGARRMLIEDDKGELIFIPYDELVKHIIIKNHPAENILSHNFMLQVPSTKATDDRQRDIRYRLLSLPWISLKKEPIIKIMDEDEGQQTYSITCYCPDKSYFYKVETALKQSFLHPSTKVDKTEKTQ